MLDFFCHGFSLGVLGDYVGRVLQQLWSVGDLWAGNDVPYVSLFAPT